MSIYFCFPTYLVGVFQDNPQFFKNIMFAVLKTKCMSQWTIIHCQVILSNFVRLSGNCLTKKNNPFYSSSDFSEEEKNSNYH